MLPAPIRPRRDRELTPAELQQLRRVFRFYRRALAARIRALGGRGRDKVVYTGTLRRMAVARGGRNIVRRCAGSTSFDRTCTAPKIKPPDIHAFQTPSDTPLNLPVNLSSVPPTLPSPLISRDILISRVHLTIVQSRFRFILLHSPTHHRDQTSTQILLPFEAEIRIADVAAKLKYNLYVTDIYGNYTANFSHIRMIGTLVANTEQEWMAVSQFNIPSSQVVSDSILFGYVPKWILDWVRLYFDNDNTQMYEQLAKVILQKEANNFVHYDMLRDMVQPPTVEDWSKEANNFVHFFALLYGALGPAGNAGGPVPAVKSFQGHPQRIPLPSGGLPPHLLLQQAHNPHHHHHHQRRHHPHLRQQFPSAECELNANPVIDQILDRMRQHLPEEKITVQNGGITIYDAHIARFVELVRLKSSCARRDQTGTQILLPFEAEIRIAHVAVKLKYNLYVTDIYGDYAANFSHIRMNGTLEANTEEEWMAVSQFNITSSQVVSDSILFGYVPKWILDWVRSYFDNDNTQMYEQLAKVILQKEANNFVHYDMLRDMVQPPTVEDEDTRLPLNRI